VSQDAVQHLQLPVPHLLFGDVGVDAEAAQFVRVGGVR
jgi:hypothetical protein